MDKKTLELILNAVFDGVEVALQGKPVLLGIVKLARPIIMNLIGKLVKDVNKVMVDAGRVMVKQ